MTYKTVVLPDVLSCTSTPLDFHTAEFDSGCLISTFFTLTFLISVGNVLHMLITSVFVLPS